MTASTQEMVTPLDLGEGSLDLGKSEELKSFPPISDTIVWFQNVDWNEVREKCRGGVNNIGLVLAVIGEKLHDAGTFLAEV
jgi:hypothetical protein